MQKILLLAVCIACVGCTQRIKPLPSAEVLRRTVLASHTLDSVAYDLSLSARLLDAQQVLTMTGQLSVAGALVRERTIGTGVADLQLTVIGDRLQRTRIEGAFSVVSQAEVDLRIDAVSTNGSGNTVVRREVGGRWLAIPMDESDAPLAVSPFDQHWITLQTSAIRVTRDAGIEMVNGEPLYHYVVSVDPEAVSTMAQSLREALGTGVVGDVWIDANTFLLKKVSWHLVNVPVKSKRLQVDIDVRLSEFNRAELLVKPPMLHQLDYPDDALFVRIFSGALVPLLGW